MSKVAVFGVTRRMLGLLPSWAALRGAVPQKGTDVLTPRMMPLQVPPQKDTRVLCLLSDRFEQQVPLET